MIALHKLCKAETLGAWPHSYLCVMFHNLIANMWLIPPVASHFKDEPVMGPVLPVYGADF